MSLYLAHRENIRNGVPAGEAHAAPHRGSRTACGIAVEFLYTDDRSDWVLAEGRCGVCLEAAVPSGV